MECGDWHDKRSQSIKAMLAFVRIAAIVGMIGPLLLGGMIAALTILQYDFMIGLRWHPLTAPTTDWPSGLSLGPYGGLMIGTFILSGALLIFFAIGLDHALGTKERMRTGPALLMLAGLATMLLAFKVDPSFGSAGRTIIGTIHDIAFGILGISLLAALIVLARHFKQDPLWRSHAAYTLITALIVAPAFWFKGFIFYLFLANILLWFELTGWRLWRVTHVQLDR